MVCVAAASQPAALFKNERPFSVLFFGESSKGHSGMLPSSCSGGGTQIVLRNQKNSAITKIIFLRQSTPEMFWNKQKNRLYGDVLTYETRANVHLSCTFHLLFSTVSRAALQLVQKLRRWSSSSGVVTTPTQSSAWRAAWIGGDGGHGFLGVGERQLLSRI